MNELSKTPVRVGTEETVNIAMQISEDLKEKLFELVIKQGKDPDGDIIDFEGKRYFVHALANYVDIIEK